MLAREPDIRADRRNLLAGTRRAYDGIQATGKNGLKVSVAGLGCGGNSRLGLGRGAELRRLRGGGAHGRRSRRQFPPTPLRPTAPRDRRRRRPQLRPRQAGDRPRPSSGRATIPRNRNPPREASLRRLGLDYIDVFHFHAVNPRPTNIIIATSWHGSHETQGTGQGAPCRHHRDEPQRSGTEDARPRDQEEAPWGIDHAGLQSDEPGGAPGSFRQRSVAASARC